MDRTLIAEVAAAAERSRRYRAIAPEALHRLAGEALRAAQGDVAEGSKRLKRQLHQIVGAYVGPSPRYQRRFEALQQAIALGGDGTAARAQLRRCMAVHASTRERLPVLERFYREIFSVTGPPHSILDLGCGLNPLAVPWMHLPAGCRYTAMDIDGALIGFVGMCLTALNTCGEVRTADALALAAAEPPAEAVDLVFLLKTLPCLDQQAPGAGLRLLDGLRRATWVVVSFPTLSLGGHKKGMAAHYAARFEPALAGRGMGWERLEFPNELVYLVRPVQ